MRKVLFKQWIPPEYSGKVYSASKPLPGTGCWSSDFIQEGLFHQWAVAYEELDTGPGMYTVALVELPDGTITEMLPSNLKFVPIAFADKQWIDKPPKLIKESEFCSCTTHDTCECIQNQCSECGKPLR